MKNTEAVFNYIKDTITENYISNCIKNGTIYGITAAQIQKNLNIVRNNASTILNQLWKESKLIKINTRPVTFIPKGAIEQLFKSDDNSLKDAYTSDELTKLISYMKSDDIVNDPFQNLIGNNGSIANQIDQAKAAIIYPPKGLHTLILGESGVGKTTFAYAMHEFGKAKKNVSDGDFPFVSFNCSDYFNNPQLLLSQLFGHVKGAFTGADSEKIGLVEKANGGILFLDEIHRLPPDGQEMLFYLMDRGEFHRMGEPGNKRKSNILLIAATTEKPDEKLLSTFLRRIPVVINLPPFREKSIDERVEIIQNAFSYESKNLNKKIRISPQVLKALSIYPFKVGNIGELRSEIKLLCAKSFLESHKGTQELSIEFKMLDKKIHENALNYTYNNKSVKAYLDMFSEDIIISPVDDKKSYDQKSTVDIYEAIIKTLEDLKIKGLSKDIIESEAKMLIQNSYKNISDKLDTKRLNISQLYKIVPKNIIDFSSELINVAQKELSTNFSNKFIFVFSLHVQSLLRRIADGKSIDNPPNIIKIKKDYPKEFNVAKKIVNLIGNHFGVIVPEYEKGFITILLVNNKLHKSNENRIKIFVICHGYSTATSMANVANTLLDSDLVKAIDMPLDANISETYNKLKVQALKGSSSNGILILADMGSLINFGEKLKNETGIEVRSINNVSTLLVIEALRSVLYKNNSLKEIWTSLINKDLDMTIQNKTKKKAILTFCSTGQGGSMIAKNILDQILSDEYKNKIAVISTDYKDAEDSFSNLKKQYDIIAVIGSFKPDESIPYFPINKLFNTGFENEFLKFLDTNFKSKNTNSNKSVYEISKEMLEQYIKYVNPTILVATIKKFIDSLKLNDTAQNQNNIIDLIIHLGCMMDRCIHGDFVKFENINEYMRKNIKLFNKIREAISILENEYNVKINNDEICYIIKIISKWY